MAAPGTPPKGRPSSAALDTTVASTSTAESDAAAAVSTGEPAPDAVPAPPPPPPLHAAAQAGDVETIHRLLTTNEATAHDRDQSNITPLHWAAINNHVLACKELLNRGADVDAVGGDLMATPMQWAARNGHLAIVHLMILHGADPALTDSQGFDTFHLATHSSSPLLLAYLLSQQLPVATDATDRAGRTCLQWACYQGDGLSVDLLLKFGANPNRPDPGGLTALHWAVVKGNVGCIAKVIEAGGDIWAKNGQGQTPLDLARQLNSVAAWDRAMTQLGREGDGRLRSRPLGERNTTIAVFLLPWLLLYLVFTTVNVLPWFTGIPLAIAEFFGVHHVITRVLLDVRPRPGQGMDDRVTKSPYMCGLVSGSVFWVGYVWTTKLVYHTPGYAYTNLAFAVAIVLCAYNLFRAVTLDPAYIPQRPSDQQLKEMVEELTATGQMNGQGFCLPCLTRRPVRSKHCRVCNRCVARHDHHCPWIWNCVGINNHRQFVLFVAFLIVGICLFDRLIYAYYAGSADAFPARPDGCLFPSPLCEASSFDTFTFATACWATLQLTWTLIVLGGQVFQICRQLTTYELSNLGRYGYMGGSGGSSLAAQASHRHTHPQHSPSSTPASGHSHGHSHGAGVLRRVVPKGLLQLVGLDLYTQGKAAEGIARAHRQGNSGNNPFDVGLWRNCTDFWSRGRTLGVDYAALYEVPEGGYRAVLRAKGASSAAPKGQGDKTARSPGIALASSSRGGYAMVPTSEEP